VLKVESKVLRRILEENPATGLARFSHQVFQELILRPDRRLHSRFWAEECPCWTIA
jgi:hypothetical protein